MLDVFRHREASFAGRIAREERVGGRLRVAVLIEHDIVYRHFLSSGVFSRLTRMHDVVFVVPENGPSNKRLTMSVTPEAVGAPVQRIAINPRRIFQQRRLFQVSQMVWRAGAKWKQLRTTTRYLLGSRASALYTLLALPGVYHLFTAWSRYRIDREPAAIDEFINRFQPEVMIHPTVLDGLFINDVVQLGDKYNIPTIAIMNSWDNPSTKRSVVGQPGWLLVWGPQTRNHAIDFMGMDSNKVIPFGVAQFEIYRQPSRESREEFCHRHGVDPQKRVLLYAGSSKGSDEFTHLCMIDEAIENGILPNLAVIYRPHPWGKGGFMGERMLDHTWKHVVIEVSMRPYLEAVRAGKKHTYLADYADTHDVLSSVDAVVSPLSTIILEAALHRKPVLCFLPEQKEGSSFDLQKKLFHFEDMFVNPLIFKAYSENALIDALVSLVQKIGDVTFADALLGACGHFVTAFERPYADRLCEFVEYVVDVSEVSRCGHK